MNDSAKVRGILVISRGNFSASADSLKGRERGIADWKIIECKSMDIFSKVSMFQKLV